MTVILSSPNFIGKEENVIRSFFRVLQELHLTPEKSLTISKKKHDPTTALILRSSSPPHIIIVN